MQRLCGSCATQPASGRNTSADESRSIGDRTRRDTPPRQQEHPACEGVCPARLYSLVGRRVPERTPSLVLYGRLRQSCQDCRLSQALERPRNPYEDTSVIANNWRRKRMKLNVHAWGTGDRTALLIHGLFADHQNWIKSAEIGRAHV